MMSLRLPPLIFSALLLSACDPGVHVGWERDFDGPVDKECVRQALTSVSPEVTRDTYVSEGHRGFPSGTEVTQFNYPDPVTHNSYSLDLALLPSGKTHYVHRWTKIGTEIPPDEQAQILPILRRANEAIASLCGLSFTGSEPEIGPG